MFNKRRTELEIIQNILDLSQQGAKKTELLYKNNMSFSQLTGYLDYLIDKDIIKETLPGENDPKQNTKLYMTTQKGENLLREINSIMDYFQ